MPIDFEELKRRFDNGRKTTEAQKLRAGITSKLARMVKMNRTRMDFLEEFRRMIDEYNAGSINVETFFAKLMARASWKLKSGVASRNSCRKRNW